jgi:hypothetical protein
MRTTVLAALALGLAVTPATAAEPDARRAPDPERVRRLVALLDDDLFAVRVQAEKDLHGLGPDVLPLLEKELPRSPSLEVTLRLGRLLEDLGGDERRVRILLKDLRDERFSRRAEADKALRRIGKKALPLLHKELETARDAETNRRLRKIIQDLELEELLDGPILLGDWGR